MNVMQTPRRDEGTAYELRPPQIKADLIEVGRGTPMGELLRRYWHPVGLAADAGDTPRKVRVLGEDLILFRDGAGTARPGASALRASRHDALLRQGRGARHPLLLSRLAVRRRRATASSSRASPTAACTRDKVRQPWYPVEELLRPGLRLHGPAREEAGAAALRMPRGAGRRRVPRGRRQQHRRRRPADHSLQLAAALREPGRPVPRADAACLVQRHAVRRRRWRRCRR